jgi:hypothetical protein
MKTLAALVLLCSAMSAQTAPINNKINGVQVTPMHDDNGYAVVLTADKGHSGDLAVVTVYYYVHVEQFKSDLLIHRTSVVELVEDIGCVSDMVPVPLKKIKWVDVALVQTIKKNRFTASELEPEVGR